MVGCVYSCLLVPLSLLVWSLDTHQRIKMQAQTKCSRQKSVTMRTCITECAAVRPGPKN